MGTFNVIHSLYTSMVFSGQLLRGKGIIVLVRVVRYSKHVVLDSINVIQNPSLHRVYHSLSAIRATIILMKKVSGVELAVGQATHRYR